MSPDTGRRGVGTPAPDAEVKPTMPRRTATHGTAPGLPVAVIGAGPIGLAAAAHLARRGLPFVVLEMGPGPGTNLLAWSHVRMFSPWRYVVDPLAADMLAAAGHRLPDPDDLPTGADVVERYLEPLARLPRLAPNLRLSTTVLAVHREGMDKVRTPGRGARPLVVRVRGPSGREEEILARAVIDASGTWHRPNPLGAAGVPALGEAALRDRIAYGIPDVLGAQRARYAGRRVLVAGSGHSAIHSLLNLAELAERAPDTRVTWLLRRDSPEAAFGMGDGDPLPARGRLGVRARRLVDEGRVRVVAGFAAVAVRRTPEGIAVSGVQAGRRTELPPVDEVIVATGSRPDLDMLRELRLDLDPALECPRALAPLIDPNVHTCGTVPPHGVELLRHPEPGFYVVGSKSYGRAPTFLLHTGYEQVRSVVAALAGDLEGARVRSRSGQPGAACGDAACCGLEEGPRAPGEGAGEQTAPFGKDVGRRSCCT